GIIDRFMELAAALKWSANRVTVEARGASFAASAGTMTFRGSTTGTAVGTPTLEERVAALEIGLQTAKEGIRNNERGLAEERDARATAVAAEAAARQRIDEEIRSEVENASAGGLDLNAAGVVPLAEGLVLCTASLELSKLFV